MGNDALADMKDLTLRQASEVIGMREVLLREMWSEIPTAYRTPSGRYRVAVWGLRQWQQTRGQS